MAFPFLLGAALGAGAVIAYNKNKKVKETADEIFEKSKDVVNDVKKSIDATVDCIKDKKDQNENTDEKKEETDAKQ